ncbi:hypothetical protein [Streptococcus oricebi]|uniref:DUF1433 domain-containing protein n=1 Tax=Streptococcus oricebi TaxID=1547447 RepID=A0ABS5B555_9STRE|nr:hypothetical protein [Streptococcus oricebi]MBP2623983.1 hypothetical protein [Streptococcus oricebi]
MKSKKIWLIIVPLVLIALIIGGLLMWQNKVKEDKEQALKRNRKYEVSLVKALKNSYAGIEEIRITKPNYTYPPGSWSCDVEMLFTDNKKIKYRIGHSLDEKQNYNGSKTYEQDDFLSSRKGKTTNSIAIHYSDKKKGAQ